MSWRTGTRAFSVCVLLTELFISISGQWMSTSAMAQEFAGLPAANGVHGPRTAARSGHVVNMYLAAYATFHVGVCWMLTGLVIII